MPTIEISFADLQALVGKRLSKSKLDDILQYAKCGVERIDGDLLAVEVEDGNRIDLWCVEGIARELKGALGLETGLPEYDLAESDYEVIINQRLRKIRPFIACAVIKGLKLSDWIIKQLMQQQEKIDVLCGRGRKKCSIGLYDFDKLTWPLSYTLTLPDENAFVPLGFEQKLTPKEILERHPKGLEYGHIIRGLRRYPILLDAKNNVLSLPPIINSNDLGKITPATQNVLIEVTGTHWSAVKAVLTTLSLNLADRGGQIYKVRLNYPYATPDGKDVRLPDLEPRIIDLDLNYLYKVLGFELGDAELQSLLKKARYDVAIEGYSARVFVPAHRADIMHAVDIIEDIAIAKGFDNLPQKELEMPTIGSLTKLDIVTNKVREICIGLGCQEILSFTLTNKRDLFEKMALSNKGVIEIENPVSNEYTCLRSWLLPSLFEVLAVNKHRDYPQKIFEVGDCVRPDRRAENRARQVRTLAIAMCYDGANLTEIKSVAEALLRALGVKWAIEPYRHPSFIESRCGKIKINRHDAGFFGEVHPKVLCAWGLELPVIALELELNALGKF